MGRERYGAADAGPEVGKRRLTAILSMDLCGYSRMMGRDEEDCLKRLTACREAIIKTIREGRGRVANTAGDAVLADFPSAKDAVEAAMRCQEALSGLSHGLPEERRMLFRAGVHLGDVYDRQGDLFGDGVNIAARIQSLAEPGGVWLSAAVFDQLANKSDIALELVGDEWLKNIEKPVKVYKVVGMGCAPHAPGWGGAGADPDRESAPVVIGVLPFDNLGPEPGQDYFCDGLTEDLTSDLAAVPKLRVVARNTMYALKGKVNDLRQLGRDIGATHIIEGSVRRSGKALRINVQLIETEGGTHLWAQRYDKEFSELFAIQDDIVKCVVTEVDARLGSGELGRSLRSYTTSTEAYDLFMQATSQAEVISPQGLHRIYSLLDKALALDPAFVTAHAWKSMLLHYEAGYFSQDPGRTMEEARLSLEKAKTIDNDAPSVHSAMALFLQAENRNAEARAEFERAVTMMPNSPLYRLNYATYCLRNDEYENALAEARIAEKLISFASGPGIWVQALALWLLDRPQEGLAVAERGLRKVPKELSLVIIHAVLSADLAMVVDHGALRDLILEIQPNFCVERYVAGSPLTNPPKRRLAERMRSLGLP